MTIKEDIIETLEVQKALFNAKKSGKRNFAVQFIFNETDGQHQYYLKVENNNCDLLEGESYIPKIIIETKLDIWKKIGAGYLKGSTAVKNNDLKIDNMFFFLTQYKKIFSGNNIGVDPKKWFFPANKNPEIKNVLVLSCSPRKEKGATGLFTDTFVEGMKRAGAEIDIAYPAGMKINPCIGCFDCWKKNSEKCIYQDKDDMKIIMNKMENAELVLWATPIYVYHCTAQMKNVMDRLFINVDPHFYNHNNIPVHPRKRKYPQYQALLAVCGYNGFENFIPLKKTLQTMGSHTEGFNYLGDILRTSCMSFILENFMDNKKDLVLDAVRQAGYELVKYRKINKKTKKTAEQEILSKQMYFSVGNYYMDKMQKLKQLLYIRKSVLEK